MKLLSLQIFRHHSSLKGFCLGEIVVRAGVAPPQPECFFPTSPAAPPVSEPPELFTSSMKRAAMTVNGFQPRSAFKARRFS